MRRRGVPSIDLQAQYAEVEGDVRVAIERVLASQRFILGPEATALESEVASYGGMAHGVAVSSGTDALLATLLALGVGPGDEVITTPYTFVATVTSIARLGARAVFVDIEPQTYNLDASRLAQAVTPRTRAILPVHLFGQMADMVTVRQVAGAHGVPIIEDAAQAIGAARDGLQVGEAARAATLSFFPSKNLGAMGDGGMVLTNDSELAHRLRLFRNHGQEPKYSCEVIGGNFRMDEIQAAILRAKLPRLDSWTTRRQRHASYYREAFAARDIRPDRIELAGEATRVRHVYNQLVARTPQRDALRAFLSERGIETAVYYPVPMHLQPAFASWEYRAGDFPEAERAARETLALPLYPELDAADIDHVADEVASFFAQRGP